MNKLRCCLLSNSSFICIISHYTIYYAMSLRFASLCVRAVIFFFFIIYILPRCLVYKWKRNLYSWFSNSKWTFKNFPSIHIIYVHSYIYTRFIYTLLFGCRSPLCVWCINACCQNWIFPLVLQGKCVLHNAWIKTFYVLSDSGIRKGGFGGGWSLGGKGGVFVTLGRKMRQHVMSLYTAAAAAEERRRNVINLLRPSFCCLPAAAVSGHPGMSHLLAIPWSRFSDIRALYHLIPPPSFSSHHIALWYLPLVVQFFFDFFFAIWPPRRNGATAANPRISDVLAVWGPHENSSPL